MNSKTLTRQAIRRAQREAKKQGRPLTQEEVLKLRIQTVSPWARGFLVALGLIWTALAVGTYSSAGPLWVTALFAGIGVGLIGFGVFGRKEQIERELKKITPVRVADAVLDGILGAL